MLTKRRIESSVPLTLNEVQADKDQLRAEFAMSTRRLELSIEELQDKASRQVIEINRKRDELTKLASESREKIRTVEELEARSADLRSRLAEREDAYSRVSADLHKAKEDLEARALDLDRMQRTVSDTRADADSKRIELVAKQTNLEDLTDKFADLEKELQDLRDNARKTKVELENATDKVNETEKRLTRLQKTNADLEEKLQRRERDISEIRSTDRSEEDSSTELTRLLMAERKKTDNVEARLAKTTLRMEALLSDASNENVSRAVETLNAEKADLRKKLDTISKERDQLMHEVTAYRENTGLEWDTERKENAILRERINDLAAQVTAMTAAIEGPESPINEILEKAEQLEKTSGGKSSANGDSLADRVRALQEAARTKSA